MEEQEGIRLDVWCGDGYLGLLRVDGVPLDHPGVPWAHPLSGHYFPLVQCDHFHQQVSLSISVIHVALYCFFPLSPMAPLLFVLSLAGRGHTFPR